MGTIRKLGLGLAAIAGIAAGALSASAQDFKDPFREPAMESLKGKKIAYLPISIGFDLAQAWGGVVKQQVEVYGMEFTSQDPNWSTDALAQGFTALLAEQPDVIVTQNPDIQSLARLMKQANAKGIVVVQMNMAGAVQTDAVVAPDLVGMGEKIAQKVVEKCGKGTNTSHKVSIVQGVLTGGVSFYQIQGINKVFAENPEIQVVSSQAADWDASKARAITETVLQQHPDVCAVIDVWDGQGVGNKHYFFMLADAKQDGPARGFLNEFLREDLAKHKRTFEALGSKLKAPASDNQLSGLGFSSTVRNDVLVRVNNRTLKLVF